MKRKILNFLQTLFLIYVFITLFLVYNKNSYKIIEIGNTTLYNEKGTLKILKNNSYKELNIGDTIYFYELVDDVTEVSTGVIESKNLVSTGIIYTTTDRPNVIIKDSYLLGKEYNRIPVLGSIIYFITSKPCIIFTIILPLFMYTVMCFYTLITLPNNPNDSSNNDNKDIERKPLQRRKRLKPRILR